MRSIAAVFSAFSNLAASVNTLSSVVDAISARLRVAVALDESAPLALPGEVLDNADEPPSTKRRKAS